MYGRQSGNYFLGGDWQTLATLRVYNPIEAKLWANDRDLKNIAFRVYALARFGGFLPRSLQHSDSHGLQSVPFGGDIVDREDELHRVGLTCLRRRRDFNVAGILRRYGVEGETRATDVKKRPWVSRFVFHGGCA